LPPREGACAVVTGGTRGIGAAICERLRADGWNVATLARSGADANADVGDSAAVDACFDALEESHGRVLVLVNNAGIRADGLALRMPAEDWDAVLRTNLTGAFNCTRRALGGMLRERWGRVVNVSSVVAEHANPGQANYVAAKLGLLGMTRTVAREMASRGITVNAVTPGLIDTEMSAEVAQEMIGAVPAGRAGAPEEVAAAVSFLVSDEAAYVNGATLAIDGALGA
jgi:NAD(P)-dependent dehydrogenase (short-subunit alcohol dehydrogenase family)